MKETESKMYLQKLDVCLMNSFEVRLGDKRLTDITIRSYMVTKLFIYMICHRQSPVSIHELTDMLWAGEECDNPIGALKNLMYRLRMILKKQLGDYPYILTVRGAYQWNNQMYVNLDMEQFENLYRTSQFEEDCRKRIEIEVKAESLYQKKMMEQFSDDYWFLSTREYYHSMYLNLAKRLAEDLEKTKYYHEMEQLCQRAIQKDGIDEDLHYYLIRSYLYQNKPKLAYEDYKKTSELLYENLGIGPSGRLQEIYEQMMKQQHIQEPDLSRIQGDMKKESREPTGAFICEYGVFKQNYELEKRRAKRQNKIVYLGLLTIKPTLQYKLDSQAYADTITLGVKQLEEILVKNLRAGDVVSRYSEAQFIMMLPSCGYKEARMVMNRINDRFTHAKHKAKVHVTYSLDAMEMG